MKRKMIAVACCLLFLASYQSFAQTLTTTDIKDQMLKDWARAKAYTIDYLNTMPADKYSFRATDSVRSFAQQMLHLSAANVFLMAYVTTEKPPAGFSFMMEQRATAQTKDSVMYFVNAGYDYAMNAVRTSDIGKWGEKKQVFGRFNETNFAILNKCFEHQGHHRGQTTVYIRLQGIKPPEERLF